MSVVNSKKKTILVSAPTGFIIRNILLGKFLSNFDSNIKVLISVPDGSKNELKKLLYNYDVELISHIGFTPDKRKKMLRILSFHYIIYLLSVGAKNNASIKAYVRRYDKTKNIYFILYRKIIIKIGLILFKLNLFNIINKIYLNYYKNHSLTKQWEDIIELYQPSYIFSTILSLAHMNKPSDDIPLIVASMKKNIPVSTLIQSWDNLSTKPSIIPAGLTTYFTWSDTQSEELMMYYPWIKPSSIKVVGSPQFDYHLDEEIIIDRLNYIESIGLPAYSRYIVFATGLPSSLPNEIDEVIHLIIKLKEIFTDHYFVIRLHPKDHSDRINKFNKDLSNFRALCQITKPNNDVHMDNGGFSIPQEFYKDQINIFYHADVVINSASTATVDAAIIGRPVICLAFNFYFDDLYPTGRSLFLSRTTHYTKIVQTKGVWVVYSENELINAISQYLKNPNLHTEGRKNIEKTVAQIADGKASQRLAQFICDSINFS